MSDIRSLAEDYVMGWLDPDVRGRVDARIAAPSTDEDRLLAREVSRFLASWEAVDLNVEPIAPPADMWAKITSAIDTGEDARPDSTAPTPGGTENVVPLHGAPAAPADDGRLGVRAWKSVAGLAIAASVALAALLATQVLTPRPLVMAILLDDNGNSVAVVEAFANDSIRVTPMAPIASPGSTQVMQVWTKPDPDGPPVSLGILDRVIRTRLSGPDLPLPSDQQLYEITLEPAGGSPSGLPEGPILGKGLAQTTF